MAKNFMKVIKDDGEFIYINKAYIVNALLDANSTFILQLDKSATHMSTVSVHHNNAKEVRDWLLEDSM